MNSFELNKILGAVLGTLLFVMGVGFVAEAIYAPIADRGAGYALPEPEAGGEVVAEPEVEEVPLGVLLASASVEQGASAVRKCQSCHNFGEGEPNKQGPGLYDVVGRVIGGHEGFAYSEVLAAKSAAGDTWSYENLDAFITNPKGFAPGTKMAFAGVKSAQERANILAYLQTLSASPVPFPAPEAVPADEVAPAAAAADAAPAAEPDAGGPATQTDTPIESTPTTSAPAAEAPAAEAPPAQAPAAPPPATQDSAVALLTSASPERGANAVRKCAACHNFGEGDPNKSGPALYAVVGRPIASHEGFKYSEALTAKGSAGEAWTYENLDAFLTAPRGFAPGTKMTFAGVKTPQERADILAYLQTLSATPVPFPAQ